MITALTSGLILGLPAGLVPGPLLALVITQSLKHNMKEGIKVALAVGKYSRALSGRVYLCAMRVVGVLLAGFALFLFKDARTFLTVQGACRNICPIEKV